MATNACAEFQTNLPGGAGSEILTLVGTFSLSNNYYPVMLGQLKYVAEPFYDRLADEGYTSAYPWTTATADDADYAPATLGQLKNVYGFDLTADSESDGLSDWWEVHYFGSITNWVSGSDPDGDGLSNLGEYYAGGDPLNSDTDGDGLPDGVDAYVRTFDTTAPTFTITYPTNGMTIP